MILRKLLDLNQSQGRTFSLCLLESLSLSSYFSRFSIFLPKHLPQNSPSRIFHAFNQKYSEVDDFVCTLAEQGYSHIQISPAQQSNPNNVNSNPNAPVNVWAGRYQPVSYRVIDGLGSEQDLKTLTDKAHSCKIKVIADVVFNHMASMNQYSSLTNFPDFPDPNARDVRKNGSTYFHKQCDINYNDGNRSTEVNCWLGGALPDLNQNNSTVKQVQKAHLQKLLDLGIDGFRFDAAKHMPPEAIQEYISYINQASNNQAWNYLEVIEDNDTSATNYNFIAAVEDFVLYSSMKNAFTFGGDLRSLRVPVAINDSRSVVFGRNHDQIKRLNDDALNAYDDETDSYLATAYVLARQQGTPLIFGPDNLVPYIPAGVKFRRIMHERGKEGRNVKDNVLQVPDSKTVLMMERGSEGFFVVNKGLDKFNVQVMDLTLTNLEGCYRELRNNFTVAIERRANNKKFVTRWGTWDRGGMEVQGRDAIYFIREPFNQCAK
ncbi:MAG: alpha-amylase [Nodosilinea sp. LVE1205-7]